MAFRSAMNRYVLLCVSFATLTLVGCASQQQAAPTIGANPLPPVSKIPEPIRDLVGPEIAQAIVGKTFQFTRKGASGFVIYNADGTMKVQDDLKGASIGKWTVNGNQYCETYSALQPMECGVFKSTGNAFFAANTRIEDMRI